MRTILLHTQNQNLVDTFSGGIDKIIVSSDEKTLFAYSSDQKISAYIICSFGYSQRAINTIRSNNQYVPIISILQGTEKSFLQNVDLNYRVYDVPDIMVVLNFIESQTKLYASLKTLTPTKLNEIYFSEGFKYETEYRAVYLNEILLRRFSTKEGKILEILSRNFGNVVKRDTILEEVWHKTDIYSSRSFDVYVSKLRNFLKDYDLKLKIRNISGVGLILEQI